jgi:hypothetical protein
MKNIYNKDLVPGQIYFSEMGNLYLILKIVKKSEEKCEVHVLTSGSLNKNSLDVIPSPNKTVFIRTSYPQV